jgi:hypothetical protein
MITKKTGGSILAVCLLGVSMSAFAGKPCEELKSEIDTKFQAKGVKNFTLDIVTNGAEDTGRSVGTCDGGTKHISYKRNGIAPPAPKNAEPAAAEPAAK